MLAGLNGSTVDKAATDTLIISLASAVLGPKRAAQGLAAKAAKFGSGARSAMPAAMQRPMPAAMQRPMPAWRPSGRPCQNSR